MADKTPSASKGRGDRSRSPKKSDGNGKTQREESCGGQTGDAHQTSSRDARQTEEDVYERGDTRLTPETNEIDFEDLLWNDSQVSSSWLGASYIFFKNF